MASLRQIRFNNTVKIGIFELKPWAILDKSKGNVSVKGGLIQDVLSYLVTNAPFKYEFVLPPRSEHGHRFDNGTWSGLIGLIQKGVVDVGVMPFIPLLQRHSAVDFSSGFAFSFAAILTGKPSPEVLQYFYKLSDLKLWWMVIFIHFIFATLITIDIVVRRRRFKPFDIYIETFFRWILRYYSILLGQPVRKIKARRLAWFLTGLWCLLTGFIHCQIFSVLRASFSTHTASSVNSLTDLVASSVTPLVVKDSVFEEYFQTGTGKIQKEIWKTISTRNASIPQKEFFDRVTADRILSGQAVLIHNYMGLKYFVVRQCLKHPEETYYFSREVFFGEPITLAVRRGIHPDLFSFFNTRMTLFAASSLFSHKMNRLDYLAYKCTDDPRDTHLVTIHTWQLYYAISIYFLGLCFSLVFFVIEFTFLKRQTERSLEVKCRDKKFYLFESFVPGKTTQKKR